jgi:hypothetical protein
MRKIIITMGLCASVLFAGSSSTTFKRKSDDTPKTISVYGIIINSSEWNGYIEVDIDLSNGETIRGKVPESSRVRENDRVRGMCSRYERGVYQNCSLNIVRY